MSVSTNVRNPLAQSFIPMLRMYQEFTQPFVRDDLTPQQAVARIPGYSSHIAWIMGHLTTSIDLALNPALGVASRLPRRYATLFAMGTQPLDDASAYPPVGQLIAEFVEALERTIAALETLPDENLSLKPATVDVPTPEFEDRAELLRANVFHNAYHIGQITALRRAQGLDAGVGA